MNRQFIKSRAIYGIALAVLVGCAKAEPEWKPLFNGTDLTGWQVVDEPESSWVVEDGVLRCKGDKMDGWLATTDEFANFELDLEFKVSADGNSGVYLRAPLKADKIQAFSGMEIQILDDAAEKYASLKPTQYTGSLYDVAAATPRVSKPAGEWQTLHILCEGTHVRVKLNDMTVVDTQTNQHPDADEKHPGLARTSGHIGLQDHSAAVEFRNIRIKKLP